MGICGSQADPAKGVSSTGEMQAGAELTPLSCPKEIKVGQKIGDLLGHGTSLLRKTMKEVEEKIEAKEGKVRTDSNVQKSMWDVTTRDKQPPLPKASKGIDAIAATRGTESWNLLVEIPLLIEEEDASDIENRWLEQGKMELESGIRRTQVARNLPANRPPPKPPESCTGTVVNGGITYAPIWMQRKEKEGLCLEDGAPSVRSEVTKMGHHLGLGGQAQNEVVYRPNGKERQGVFATRSRDWPQQKEQQSVDCGVTEAGV